MFDKRRLGRTTRRWRIVNIAVPIRRRQGAFAPHVVSCWTNDSVPAGSMHTDPKVRNCDTGRSPTPSTWQGDRAAAGEGLIALFCPSQARAFSTKALNLSQRAAAVLWSWSASRPEGWGPGSSRCCRQLISQDPGAREQDVATTSGRRSSFEGRCVDPASPTQPGRASRQPGDHRRTRCTREFCQLSFSSKNSWKEGCTLGGTLLGFRGRKGCGSFPKFNVHASRRK